MMCSVTLLEGLEMMLATICGFRSCMSTLEKA